MDTQRLVEFATTVIDPDEGVSMEYFCEAVVDTLSATGTSIALASDGEHRGVLAASDPLTAEIEELQFSLGEGPGVDASLRAGPVLEPDLAAAARQWPAFAPAAVERGIRAAFSFPLQIGAIHHSVLNVYRAEAGGLEPNVLDDATALSHMATHLLLEAEGPLDPSVLIERVDLVQRHRTRVHQATGMVAAQMGADVATALAMLRAHAWRCGASIDDVATEVLDRRLRFDPATA